MNRLSRRSFLKAIGLAAATTGCSTIINEQTQPGLPSVLRPIGGEARHPIAHLLNRATFGPRPGQIEAVTAQGREAWINQQLDYRAIDDGSVNLRLRRYDTLKFRARDLISFGPGNHWYARNELAVATMMRAIYSKRQLYEVMVGFWSDHFSVYQFKGDTALLKTVDDREAMRPHALGKFHDLLSASAHSPAMLIYLDNVRNSATMLNENYGREIMELHTLGVDGGYTEDDIKEVAKCFTGWTVNDNGEFTFNPDWHVIGEKRVLGEIIRSDDPKAEGERVIELLAGHRSTARYVCTKLVRRLVADEPPANIVSAAESTWNATSGDIPAVVRTILTHPEFDTAPPKLKRPFELVASLLRLTNAAYNGDTGLMTMLGDMGHRPFAWPTPDGYPDTAIEWTGNMLDRWNFALDVFAGDVPGVSVDSNALTAASGTDDLNGQVQFFGRLLLKRDLSPEDEAILLQFYNDSGADLTVMLGMLAASPAFQWR